MKTYQKGGTGGDTGGEHMVPSQAKTEQIVKDKKENKDYIHPHQRGDQVQVEWSGEIISKQKRKWENIKDWDHNIVTMHFNS